MPAFTDKSKVKWDLTITGATIKRVKGLLGVDLGALLDGDPSTKKDGSIVLTRMATDIIYLVDLLYAILQPQCEERNLSDEQFAAVLEGPVLFGAYEQLTAGLTEFYKGLGRDEIVAAIAKQRELQSATTEWATAKIASDAFDKTLAASLAKADAEIDKRLQAIIDGPADSADDDESGGAAGSPALETEPPTAIKK